MKIQNLFLPAHFTFSRRRLFFIFPSSIHFTKACKGTDIPYISIVRISEQTCQAIKSNVSRMAPDAECYLFGSRTIDAAKGGDIDILVISPERIALPKISRIRRLILNQIGEQKIDIVNFPSASDHPFKRAVLENAIKL